MNADLAPRLVSGVVMAGLALAALYAGGDFFVVFWGMAALAVFWEWHRIVGGPRPAARLCVGWLAVVAAAWFARQASMDGALLSILVGALALAFLGGAGRRAWNAFGVIYAGSLIVATVGLGLSLEGYHAILWLFALVWGADTMAFAGGRLIGGPKLWPRVSPGKTWSGFIVGVCGGTILGLAALYASDGVAANSWAWLLGAGLCAAVVSQGGDLFESAVKRRFDVKDSSHLIPGHGGFMDRLDGFIAASVFVALLGAARGSSLQMAIGALRW